VAAASVTAATGKCEVNVNEDASVADVVRRKGDGVDVLIMESGLLMLILATAAGDEVLRLWMKCCGWSLLMLLIVGEDIR
jgi:hypothetical protein